MVNKIIRSKRRTILLSVKANGEVIVRAPFRATTSQINNFIVSKRSWLERTLKKIKLRPKPIAHEFNEGEIFFYLGKSFTLNYDDSERYNNSEAISLSDNLLLVPAKYAFDKPALIKKLIIWYRQQAAAAVAERITYYSKILRVSPSKVRITAAKKRWGSCSKRNSVSFSWRLAMAPLEVLDYVVVHELAHIAQHNHSRKFWLLIAEVLPGYRDCEKWLNDNGQSLNLTS